MTPVTTDCRRFPDVPTDPVRTDFVSSGILRERALFFSPARIEYRASHSFLFFSAFTFILAGFVWHLPCDVKTDTPLNLAQCFALILCWGGLCTLIPFFYVRQLGMRTVIDLKARTVATFQRNRATREFSLADLQCLQLCYARRDRYPAYELNLCFANAARINLIAVAYKRPALKLAMKLAGILRKEILDCTEENRKSIP